MARFPMARSPRVVSRCVSRGRSRGRPSPEHPEYLARQLVTCIGNKRALLPHIEAAVERVAARLGRRRLRCMDVFSGSGVVSRLLKRHCATLVANDLEDYAAVVSRCHLANRDEVDERALADVVADLNARVDSIPLPTGFVEEMYAPRDERRIRRSDRVFYTRANARRIDNYRRMIAAAPREFHDLLLGPLVSAASVHANTAGVFKGFYKNRATKAGQFGGSGGDALARIRGAIELAPPVLSRHACECLVMQDDANAVVRRVRDLDLAYVDPPYNQHPYGSNYFMLNLVVNYARPTAVSPVSGIPTDWRRSGYNVRARSAELLADLVRHLDARFLLVSYNDEGFIPPAAMQALLAHEGRVEVVELPYTAFRGSRNLRGRPIRVTEHLFLVER
jgi:adenine-specific DNA-methyltransferase